MSHELTGINREKMMVIRSSHNDFEFSLFKKIDLKSLPKQSCIYGASTIMLQS
jgi:hypothetical protein